MSTAHYPVTVNKMDWKFHNRIDTGPTGRLSVPAAQSRVSLGEEVALAVRPEKLRITDEPPAGGYNGLRGKLIAESYAGDRSHYFLDVAGLSRRVTVASLNELPSSTRPGIDGAEEVWVVWPIESGLLLTS